MPEPAGPGARPEAVDSLPPRPWVARDSRVLDANGTELFLVYNVDRWEQDKVASWLVDVVNAAGPGRDEAGAGELPATMTEPVQYQGDADDAGMPSAWGLLGIMPDVQPPRPDPAVRPGDWVLTKDTTRALGEVTLDPVRGTAVSDCLGQSDTEVIERCAQAAESALGEWGFTDLDGRMVVEVARAVLAEAGRAVPTAGDDAVLELSDGG